MSAGARFASKDIALTITFTALYALFGFLKISPIIGLSGQAITAAAIMAPIIGILFGPYIGTLSALLGGVIGFTIGSFSQPSFFSGIIAALCAGLIQNKRRRTGALIYASLLTVFALYPYVGPAWLFPISLWFQIAGLTILFSPLQSAAVKNLNSNANRKLVYSFFVTSLTSTLAGQIAGSLIFELMIADPITLKGYWIGLTLLYPVERVIIALAAGLIGASLYKVLRKTNLIVLPNGSENRKMMSEKSSRRTN